jgi:hypothetical protein
MAPYGDNSCPINGLGFPCASLQFHMHHYFPLRRECRRAPAVPVCSCAHLTPSLAHETAGAASTRHSLHPPFSKEGTSSCKPRTQRVARMQRHICVGWVERSETHHPCAGLDGYRFAPPILRTGRHRERSEAMRMGRIAPDTPHVWDMTTCSRHAKSSRPPAQTGLHRRRSRPCERPFLGSN